MGDRLKDAPTFVATPKGDELVIMTRDHYDMLVGARGPLSQSKQAKDDRPEDEADAETARVRRAEWVAAGKPSAPLAVVRRVRAGDSWLRAFRAYRGVTQSELATQAGIGQGYLSAIETNRKMPSPDARAALAMALNVHPLFLSEDAPTMRDGDAA